MGVIRKLRTRSKVVSFSHDSVNSLGISQPPTPPSEAETVVVEDSPPFTPQRRDPALLVERLEAHQERQRGRTGARKTRRADNARALQTLAEEDVSLDALTITDIAPRSDGVFAQLFNDCDKMRIWQYFIALSEEDQEKYLETMCSRKSKRKPETIGGVSFTQTVKEEKKELPEEEGFTMIPPMEDCREMHPAYTPEQRFWQVDKRLRSVLKSRQFPMGVLVALEGEIMDLFSSDPSAVYITQELDSLQRLLVHALCQYNLLHSKSTSIANIRRIKVENTAKCFHIADMSLTQYVEKYYGQRQ